MSTKNVFTVVFTLLVYVNYFRSTLASPLQQQHHNNKTQVGVADVGFQVRTCNDVINYYANVGYTVTDCYYLVKPFDNLLMWRLDDKFSNSQASGVCKLIQNGQLLVVQDFRDQATLNALFKSKTVLDTWMWIGIHRQSNTNQLMWIDGTPVPALRWHPPQSESMNNGDCAVLLLFGDDSGDTDNAGTFYYTEDCNNEYISGCQASL